MSKPKTAQKYFVPDLGVELKVETISTGRFVVHFPTGPERVRYTDMKEWTHLGEWREEYDLE
jgi:hypothetical protein